MRILVIEDEDPKLDAVLRLLRGLDPSIEIDIARSVRSGMEKLQHELPALLLLDMSLPTFDISPEEAGGRPQGFGGIEIVRYLDSQDFDLPVVVVSGYEAFSKEGKNIELKTLGSELIRDYPQMIRGVVYFNPLDGHWSADLSVLVKHALGSEK